MDRVVAQPSGLLCYSEADVESPPVNSVWLYFES